MARVHTTFVTPNNVTINSPFRSVTPKRAILKRHPNDSSNIEEFDATGAISETLEFPFGPKDLKFDGMAANLVQIARPGKRPLLEKENNKLRQVTFNAVIAVKETGGTTSVIPMLETLEMLAGSGAVCSFTYGTTKLGFSVCLTSFSHTVKYRNSEGEPVRVDASLTLTEKPVFTQELVQLDVIPFTPPKAKLPPAPEDPPDDPEDPLVGTNAGISASQQELRDRGDILILGYNEEIGMTQEAWTDTVGTSLAPFLPQFTGPKSIITP